MFDESFAGILYQFYMKQSRLAFFWYRAAKPVETLRKGIQAQVLEISFPKPAGLSLCLLKCEAKKTNVEYTGGSK
jgi:hypothetical protein